MRIVAAVAILVLLISNGVAFGKKVDKTVDYKVDSLMSKMTLEEKIGQMVLFTSHFDVTGPTMRNDEVEMIRKGRCGNIFNAVSAQYTRQLQEIAVKETRLGIPLLFGYDVIHGFKTIFPISLGEAASWDLKAIEESARVSAVEAAVSGIHWTYAPMVDICREPRWGRISEGAGEDTFLGCEIAKARVKGFQGKDLSDPFTVLSCVKHFAAYGAPQAGRDYYSVDMSERVLREVYLPPYKAAIDAGSLSVMTSFNDLDGIPASGNKYLMTDILRDEWGFDGFVVTDYTAINEMVPHGVAADNYEAGLLAINAGVDMDMQGGVYFDHLKQQVEEGKVSEKQINVAVGRILKLKFMMGLFDDPYRYCDKKREKDFIYSQEHLDAAYDVAKRSLVLLKNEDSVLPLNKNEKIAVIGPLANSKRDLLGSWKASGGLEHAVTVLQAIKKNCKEVFFARGCKINDKDPSGFDGALEQAKKADKVVMVLGESWKMSGEAACRTDITIPGLQGDLLEKINKLGKPVVLVLMNGRPLALTREERCADAILETWYPGVRGGEAVADVLFGKYNPGGKLPVTFPRNLGQVPIFYNHKNSGRPVNPEKPKQKYKSNYLDSPNDPLYPFGYGLSYTSFSYSDIKLSNTKMFEDGSISVTVEVTNTGDYDGEEVVQLYIKDKVASVTRPVKELKNFQKIFLKKGQTKQVTFTITNKDVSFYRKDMSFGSEAGAFDVYVGGNSRDVVSSEFNLITKS